MVEEPKTIPGSSGLPLDRFEAAVDAFADLTEVNRAQILLSPDGTECKVRVQMEQFQEAYVRHMGHAVHRAEAPVALEEVRQILMAYVEFEASVDFVDRDIHEALKDKLELVSTRLISSQAKRQVELISARRETAIARREAEHLKAENTRLIEHLGDLSATLRSVSHVVAEKKDGEVQLQESHEGIVLAIQGDEVAVRYQVGDRFVEQVYDRAQFVNGRIPNIGDVVEACVLVFKKAIRNNDTIGELSDDFGRFQGRSVVGPFKI